MAYCFISDLHLQEDRPDITQAFIGFLDTTAKEAERLYILGDLFEAWIGDDLKTELSLIIKEKLSLLNDSSTIIFAMHGNRDFLIGEKFCEDTGITLLDDPCKLELFGKATLLMHGDLLCTKDVDYQEFRNASRDPQWRKEFLNKPIEEREKIAKELRSASKRATNLKNEEIMDVSPEAVEEIMASYNTQLLIHGHTHRPKVHSLKINGTSAQRIVLGDWDQSAWYIWMDDESCQLKQFSIT
tara:strand:- start:198 stop:923 length:726 start_codon:yes stop_codon:yes gene_type:complete